MWMSVWRNLVWTVQPAGLRCSLPSNVSAHQDIWERDASSVRCSNICRSYRLPMKMREGNVFSHACLSVILFTGSQAHSPTPPPCPGPQSCPLPWRVQTYSNWTSLYKDTLPQNVFKIIHYEARTVSKRAVGIRLECLLVYVVFTFIVMGCVVETKFCVIFMWQMAIYVISCCFLSFQYVFIKVFHYHMMCPFLSLPKILHNFFFFFT